MKFQRIKDLREDKDMKQIEIANLLNVGLSTYQRYERGELRIYLDTSIKLAEFYNISLDYIAGRTNDKRGFNKSDLPDVEVDLLKKFRSLSEQQRGIIIGRIEAMTEENEEKQTQIKEVG